MEAPEGAKNMYLDLSAAQSDENNQHSDFVITESDDENNKDLPTAPKLDAEVDTENNDLDIAAPESNENKNFEFAPESEGENNVNFVTRDADEDKDEDNFKFVAPQSDMTLLENNKDVGFAVSASDEYNDLKSDGYEEKSILYDVPAKKGMINWLFYHLISIFSTLSTLYIKHYLLVLG